MFEREMMIQSYSYVPSLVDVVRLSAESNPDHVLQSAYQQAAYSDDDFFGESECARSSSSSSSKSSSSSSTTDEFDEEEELCEEIHVGPSSPQNTADLASTATTAAAAAPAIDPQALVVCAKPLF